MNNSGNYFDLDASAAPDPELLRELMPKLGLEATEPKYRYKNQLRLRLLLPRVLLLCVLAAVLFFVVSYALTPARVQDMQIDEGASKVEIAFDTDKVMLLESVTAQMNGMPVAVQHETMGSYKIEVDKNGQLEITARTFTGRESVTEVAVTSIDDEPPHISDHSLDGEDMVITFTDNGGSGIDWQSLQATLAASGESFEIPVIDEQNQLIRFPFPDESVRITMTDNNGNPLAVMLELVSKGG